MNIRKEHDYSALLSGLDQAMCANFSQMKLYCELGRLICGRQEKGAAVAAAAYLAEKYPNKAGFSARNVRRMRDFYRVYENVPELLAQAMRLGWTQNVVILEADLTVEERAWYLRAAEQFGWSKLTLQKKIAEAAHLEKALDPAPEICYNSRKTIHQSRFPRSDLQLRDTEPNKAAEVAFAQNDTGREFPLRLEHRHVSGRFLEFVPLIRWQHSGREPPAGYHGAEDLCIGLRSYIYNFEC